MPVADDAVLEHPTRAQIDPAGCIGCAKCLPACPVDAILGSRAQLHAVLTGACTGCALCLPPCPTNCITLVPAPLDFDWPRAWGEDLAPARAFLAAQARMESERTARKAARVAGRSGDREEEYVRPPADLADRRLALAAGPRSPQETTT